MSWQSTLHTLIQSALNTESIPFSVCALTYVEQAISLKAWSELSSQAPENIQNAYPKRQSSFYSGRQCAERALAELGQSQRIEIGQLREPLWPKGVLGSITHTSQVAMAVAVQTNTIKGIGIDLEPVLDEDSAKAIYESVLSDVEKQKLDDWAVTSGLTELEAITLIFSVKESFYKGIFKQVNRILEFSAIEIESIEQGIIRFRLNEQSLIELYPETTLFDGHFVAAHSHVVSCVVLP